MLLLQLSLPDSVTERVWHSLSALQLSPHIVLLVIFGGRRSLGSARLSHTVLIELSEHYQCIVHADCSTAAIDTGQWYMCTADITAPLSQSCRKMTGNGRWVGY